MRRLTAVVAVVALVLTVGACEAVTGHPRCDERVWYPVRDILDHGATVDCTPNFSSTDQHGIRHHAWWDPDRRTVWVWPNQMSDKLLLKILWHEAGHVAGRHTEWGADAYAYCRMTREQRSGIGFLLPTPTCHG